MTCLEAQELITALVDQELSSAERQALDDHLRQCKSCAALAAEEKLLKQALQSRAERLRAPAALRQRILSDERIFPKPAPVESRAVSWRRSSVFRRGALAAILLLALALPLYLQRRSASESIAVAALSSQNALAESLITSAGAEKPDDLVARVVRESGGHFHPMGYDLSAAGLQPVAGSFQQIQGRKVLVVMYRGPGGILFCYTFVGTEADAPVHAAKFFDRGKRMNFYAFSRGPLNAVMHREGELNCILASEMPMDALLDLTRSQARSAERS
jgi:anti-sigma factor RsiW